MALPGRIRIIAGHWRGRKIDVLDAPGLRPTPDRVRETLFNWLQVYLPGSICLDLFAGTGALGFEALSRDASKVVMIESNRTLVQHLEDQAEQLGSERHDIQQADALSWLAKTNQTFDIIFLDPPFKQGLIEQCLGLIKEKQLLKQAGRIYIEAEKTLSLPTGWEILKHKKAGQVQSLLLTQ